MDFCWFMIIGLAINWLDFNGIGARRLVEVGMCGPRERRVKVKRGQNGRKDRFGKVNKRRLF